MWSGVFEETNFGFEHRASTAVHRQSARRRTRRSHQMSQSEIIAQFRENVVHPLRPHAVEGTAVSVLNPTLRCIE